MTSPVVLANEYSGEHIARRDIMAALTEHDYVVERWSLVDKGNDQRVLTIVASKPLGGVQQSLNFNPDPARHPDDV